MNNCIHYGQRHFGGRCTSLPISHYSPRGVRPNELYREPGVVLPALSLTAVEAVVSDHMAVDRPPSREEPEAVHAGKTPIEVVAGPSGVILDCQNTNKGWTSTDSSLYSTGLVPASSTNIRTPYSFSANSTSFNNAELRRVLPALPDDGKMHTERAALIAATSEDDPQPADHIAIGQTPGMGPRSSGAKDMPLGARKVKSSISVARPVLTKTGGGSQLGTPPPRGNVSAHPTTSRPFSRGGLPANGGRTKTRRGPVPKVPPKGQKTFSKNNNSAGLRRQETAAHAPASQTSNSGHGTVDQAEWDKLERHIRDAVTKASRPSKPFNARTRVNKNINEAINLLKPIILGVSQQPSNLDFEGATQHFSVNMVTSSSMGSAPMQLQPPPKETMVWNWVSECDVRTSSCSLADSTRQATGTCQWMWP